MKKYIILLFFINITYYSFAQIQNQIDIDNQAISPSEQRYKNLISNLTAKELECLLNNPASHKLKFVDSSINSYISTSYTMGKLNGDFLIKEGNDFSNYKISGFGKQSLPKYGTLYGKANFAVGKHKNIGWNAVRFPELYSPYISTDSLGGDFNFKYYYMLGGYSFEIKKWIIGIETSFNGEQAHRTTDPRALNTTSWIKGKIGIAKFFNQHLFMLNIAVSKNKQHSTLRYWRAGEQERFFVSYGFGMFDLEHSLVLFGYSRMYYINKISNSIVYKSPTKNKLSVFTHINYNYSKMKTEETNIKNLYTYEQNSFNSTLKLNFNANNSWNISFIINNLTNIRKGYENVFETYLVDKINRVYDFRLLNILQNYKLTTSNTTAVANLCAKIGKSKINLFAGIMQNYRKESYNKDVYFINNSSTNPYAGFEYSVSNTKNELTINCSFTKKIPINNEYKVNLISDKEYLDFQHAFTKYAFYNSSFNSVRSNVNYMRKLKSSAIGINLQLLYTAGQRDEKTIYSKPISFESSAPIINTQADKHNEKWLSISLIYEF